MIEEEKGRGVRTDMQENGREGESQGFLKCTYRPRKQLREDLT